MNPLCRDCKGACCRVIEFKTEHKDTYELFEGRMIGDTTQRVFLNCQCRHLTKEGLCGIYETRPKLCRTFEPKSPECMAILRSLRPEIFRLVEAGKYNENKP